MPSEINQLMAREAEETFDEYDYIKGDLDDKLDEYESVRANVKGAHSDDTRYRPTNKFVSDNKGASLQPKDAPFFRKAKLPIESNTGTSRGFKPKCFICENVGHLARECSKNTRKTPPRNARSNIITTKGIELEFTKEVVTARVSIPVCIPINTRNRIDDLQLVDIRRGQTSIKAVIGAGAQISDLAKFLSVEVEEKHNRRLAIPTCLLSTDVFGPLKLLKEVCTGDKEIPTGSSKSIEEYLRDLTEKLKQAHNLARGNSEKVQVDATLGLEKNVWQLVTKFWYLSHHRLTSF
ncbi:hypothetical protein TNCV_3919961 [Trichonephila clavipes]|nr:hypothetical protein TNCV_3919961 [Trichonephila clavipes]